MMQIAINVRSILKAQNTGIGRYTANLVQNLVRVDPENQYVMYVTKKLLDFRKKCPRFRAKNLSCCVDWNSRGPVKKLTSADIYHVPHPDMIERMPRVKVVVTVHDFVYKAFAQGHTDETLALTDAQMKSFLPFVDKIICCSRHTQMDLHRFFDVDLNKTCVVYQGVDKTIFFPLQDEDKASVIGALKIWAFINPIFFLSEPSSRAKISKAYWRRLRLLRKRESFQGIWW